MSSQLFANADLPPRIDQIETDWTMVHEPAHVVLRYEQAIQGYLQALINNRHDAEDVAQEFFLWVSQHGLPLTRRGRFRDYLKKVVRNRAFNFLRHNQVGKPGEAQLLQIPDPDDPMSSLEQEWIGEWKRCLLNRTWQRLREHQKKSDHNLAYTVLRLRALHPNVGSEVLADKVATLTDKPLRVDAFRKQVSRARSAFAQYLVDEVAQTLFDPELQDVEEELADLGLIQYVRRFLPLRRRRAI